MKNWKTEQKTLFNIADKWLPVFLWAFFIFLLSSHKTPKVTEFFFWDFVFKKSAHVFVYAVLYLLVKRATKKTFLSFVLTMLYAISDEYHQSFTQGRTPSTLDLGFDLSGANIAAYISWKLNLIRQKKLKK